MLQKRVIPCLLLKNRGLVKTTKFKKPVYVGDPINTIRIFNEKEVDELIFLDIDASSRQSKPDFNLIAEIASECFMPLCYGGGVHCLNDLRTIFSLGVEKIAINYHAVVNPDFIRQAVDLFGSQSIVLSMDVKKSLLRNYEVYILNGRKRTHLDPVMFAIQMEALGVGEILLNSINNDGIQRGYDLEIIKKVSEVVNVPVIACGGAGCLNDFSEAVNIGGAAAVAAGSLFVFHGKNKAVLVSYPKREELEGIFK